MPSRIGIPSVGRVRLPGSGLLASVPPGVFSHDTMPQSLPLQFAICTWARFPSTAHSPRGSAGDAQTVDQEAARAATAAILTRTMRIYPYSVFGYRHRA